MNCKRCIETGERNPGRVTNLTSDPRTGSVFAVCTDHSEWMNRLMDTRRGFAAQSDLYDRFTCYRKDAPAITRPTTAKARKLAVDKFADIR